MMKSGVKTLLLCLLAVSIGCAERIPCKAKAKPSNQAVITIEDSAEIYFRTYAVQAASAAAVTAEKCRAGEFRDVTAADDFFNSETKKAREFANGPFAEAMTKALDDEKGKPAADVAEVYDQLAAGFSRVAGVTIKGETAKTKRASPSRSTKKR